MAELLWEKFENCFNSAIVLNGKIPQCTCVFVSVDISLYFSDIPKKLIFRQCPLLPIPTPTAHFTIFRGLNPLIT